METKKVKEKKWTYLRDRMVRIYDRAEYLFLIFGALFVLFVTFYSNDWMYTLWQGLIIIVARD
ncbi:MAG: hypothetical protein O9309_10540 [Rhizobium sp.]|nr:hypothetical protein [Rhizobium sp.]MCZ8349035.1 hypothetical protein [Rhizobium sp.]